uniref:Uncharacterized protein n=1 Tax=Romanomermis culicivorax TaxID=13658 RepID=A0A915L2J5_ROMCU
MKAYSAAEHGEAKSAVNGMKEVVNFGGLQGVVGKQRGGVVDLGGEAVATKSQKQQQRISGWKMRLLWMEVKGRNKIIR